MKKYRFEIVAFSLAAILIGVLVAVAVFTPPAPVAARVAHPSVIIETLDPSLEQFAPMWRDEIGRRFTNAVGILVHGADFEEGRWIVGAHVQRGQHVTLAKDVVDRYRAKYPDRALILLACNTGHVQLTGVGKNVFFARSSVWCLPDRAITPEMYENGLAFRQFPFGEYKSYSPPDEAEVLTEKTRWEMNPEVVGSIFEFVEAE